MENKGNDRTNTGEMKSETARENSKNSDSAHKQKHENRENPEKDHVPGHMGYNRSNLDTVVTTPTNGQGENLENSDH